MTCRSYFQTAPLLPTVLSSCQGEVGYEYGTIVSSLSSPGVRRSTRPTSPPRSIHNHAELVVPVLRAFSKHDDLLPTHAEGLLGTGMQRALANTNVRINDVSASSPRI